MGRRPRIHFRGACYHLIVRGNNKQRLFFSIADRKLFLELIGQGVRRFRHRIHGYCLMSNHAHFAIQVADNPLSTIVHNLTSRYARAVNSRMHRTGHLFERRYRAWLVDTDAALLQLIRYVHRNPVEAGLVRRCGDYPWSSHRGYLTGQAPVWLHSSFVLGLFGRSPQVARRALARFVERSSVPPEATLPPREQAVPEPQDVTVDDVLEAAAQILGVLPARMRDRTRHRRVSRARLLAAVLIQESSQLSLRRLGEALDREASGMTHAARLGRELARSEPTFRQQLKQARGLLRCRPVKEALRGRR